MKRKADDDDDLEKKKHVVETIKTKIQNLDEYAAITYVETISRRWHLDSPPTSFEHAISLAFENFKLDVMDDIDKDMTGSYGMRDVADTIHEHEIESISLYHRLRELDILIEQPDILGKISSCLETIYYAKRIVLATFQSRISLIENKELDEDLDTLMGSWSLRFRWFDTEINDVQKLLLHLLDVAMEKRYRKIGDRVFEPILVDGYNTHAWRSVCDIEQFVYSNCQKEVHLDAWIQLTNGNNNAKVVCSHLEKNDDYQFPRLVKDRNVWSFRNGVYLGREDRFHEFASSSSSPLPSSIVSCKFFDFEIDPYIDVHWTDIPTPATMSILEYQGFSDDVIEWFFILLGRMMYAIGEKDGWQVIPFLLGAAGTGKSSITNNIVAELYDSVDVGLLSNNSEKQFGLSAFYDKFVFVAPEIKSDMKLEQAEFQSMCSGEDIQIAIKHKTAFSVKWTTPGFLAGNETPTWTDNSGSIQRRVIIFQFGKPVAGGDMLLGNRLKEEMGKIILKSNRAYLEASAKYGAKNIWEVLPAYFKHTRNEMAASVNVVEAFLISSDVIMESGKYVPFEDFKCALKIFEHANGYKSARYTIDFFRGPFAKFKLQKITDVLPYRGKELKREYVMGIDLVHHEDFNVLG
jgi:hypothetical protein